MIVGVGAPPVDPRLVRTALALALDRGAVLYAVDVRCPEGPSSGATARAPRLQDADFAFSRTEGIPDDVDVRIVVVEGRPGAELVRLADRDSDLLVVGRSRRRRRSSGPFGEIVDECAANAVCPVIVVPPDATPYTTAAASGRSKVPSVGEV
ncbi:MAG: universal stress protein [Pseudonocardia sp.]|nr:universal stress protein [Pseudonocardia sp.]